MGLLFFINGYVFTPLLIAIILLGLSYIILIILSTYLRITDKKRRLNRKRLQKFINPSIIAYLEGFKTKKMVETELTTGQAIVLFEELIFNHIDTLQGSEKQRLSDLLKIPKLYNFRYNQLFSKKKSDIVSACLYFQYCSVYKESVKNRLLNLLDYPDHIIVHGAASALMTNQEVSAREIILRKVAKHEWISSMALIELMYKFVHLEQEQMENEITSLKRTLMDSEIPERNLAVIVKAVVDMGYAPLVEFLNYYYINNKREDPDGELKGSLILTLGIFQYLVKTREYVVKEYRSELHYVRRACAIYFGETGDPGYTAYLIELAKDEYIDVRIEALYALIKLGNPGIYAIKHLIEEGQFNYTAINSIKYLDYNRNWKTP